MVTFTALKLQISFCQDSRQKHGLTPKFKRMIIDWNNSWRCGFAIGRLQIRISAWATSHLARSTQPSIPPGSAKWVPAVAGKAKDMVHSDCRWTCGCAAKTVRSLENTCHIPERFCGDDSLRSKALTHIRNVQVSLFCFVVSEILLTQLVWNEVLVWCGTYIALTLLRTWHCTYTHSPTRTFHWVTGT